MTFRIILPLPSCFLSSTGACVSSTENQHGRKGTLDGTGRHGCTSIWPWLRVFVITECGTTLVRCCLVSCVGLGGQLDKYDLDKPAILNRRSDKYEDKMRLTKKILCLVA
ncbi:hypothetical protein BDW22DRAFT_355670 [Trametopsis cervina]|nr:hypothetical protein BDW22DRAFT_355670 [Trametopsis cervina]